MAIKTYMKPILSIIGSVVAAYAKGQGLERSDFSLSGAWQERTDRVSLVLATTKNVRWFSWYQEIVGLLQSRFEEAGAPDAAWNVGLVVLTERKEDELHSGFQLADGEEDVTDYLEATIDKEWPEQVPSQAAIVTPD